MAYSMSILLWGLIRYEDAYSAAGELGHMRETVRWGLDFLLKSHTDKNEFYVQVSGCFPLPSSLPPFLHLLSLLQSFPPSLPSLPQIVDEADHCRWGPPEIIDKFFCPSHSPSLPPSLPPSLRSLTKPTTAAGAHQRPSIISVVPTKSPV